jgi:hypothetical protein
MGNVYRARDTRLGRQVALKVLPRSVSQDAQRLARFDREARFLASLNHPGIGAIYGVEESEDGPLLVLELVSGDTLSDRLLGPALPLTEALSICRQIAEALAYAHATGVIHRDLKPANVKRTRDGRVKVLDFGLAKALASETQVDTNAPAISEGGTRDGTVLGTSAYMSPEQARGKEIDKRTDVWSFGCVLYERLTSRRAFQGQTVTDTLVAVLGHEPDWTALPTSTPSSTRALLRRCLQRDRDRRLHDMADARIELDEALAAPDAVLGAIPAAAPAETIGPSGLESASLVALALSAGAYAIVEARFLGPLAGLYAEIATTLSLPLRVNIIGARWLAVLLGGLALLWAGLLVAGRPVPPPRRRRLLVTSAAIVAVWTLAGLLLTVQQAVSMAGLRSLGAQGLVVERDLMTLYIASCEPGKVIARLDPQRTRDIPGDIGWWPAPGVAFQLAEAYRAEGDIDSARRLYRRAEERAAVFDEDLSQKVLSSQERWQSEFTLRADWLMRIHDVRSLPDLIRATAQRRLEQLEPAAAPAASNSPPAALR